jgi:hypothetical protein
MHHVRHDAAKKNEMNLQPEVVIKSNPNPNFNIKTFHSVWYLSFVSVKEINTLPHGPACIHIFMENHDYRFNTTST